MLWNDAYFFVSIPKIFLAQHIYNTGISDYNEILLKQTGEGDIYIASWFY